MKIPISRTDVWLVGMVETLRIDLIGFCFLTGPIRSSGSGPSFLAVSLFSPLTQRNKRLWGYSFLQRVVSFIGTDKGLEGHALISRGGNNKAG
jgi:hypothetical protein